MKLYEVVGRASDMSLNGIDEVDERASEGQIAWVNRTSFAVGSLSRVRS